MKTHVGRKQGRQSDGSQECRGPQEEMGQEGIQAPDAGVGEARRQTKRQRQTEGKRGVK